MSQSRSNKRQTKTSPGNLTIVSLEQAKLYLREVNSDLDNTIQLLIDAAVQTMEAGLDYFIDTDATIYQYFDKFDTELLIWHRYISSTEADTVVQYWDGTTWQTVTDTYYRVSTSDTPPKVFLRSGQTWPTPSLDMECVRVGFKVDQKHSFYDDIRGAILALVAHQYEDSEQSVDIPPKVLMVINRHKLHS